RTYYDEGLMTSITLAALKPYEERIDTAQNRRENLIRSFGHRMLNERFIRKSRNGEAGYLYAKTGSYRAFEVIDGSILSIQTAPADWSAAMADAEQELRRAILYGFSQSELDEQLAKTRRSLEVAVERANTRKTYAGGFQFSYADALTSSFANESVFTSPQSALERFEAGAGELTLENVNAAFREAWQGYEDPAIYYISGEPLEDAETVLAAAFDQSSQVAVAPREERVLGEFAYTDFGEPGALVSDVYVEDADAHLITFANNVRLNFKQTDFVEGSISINVRAGDGFMSMPRDSEGLRRLALNVLDQSGVVAHDTDDLRSMFAGRRVGSLIRTRLNSDAFEILGNTGVEDLAMQLNLMAARVSAPAFREEIAKRHFQKMRAWYPTHDSSPNSVADKYLPRLIRSGDTRFGYDDLTDFLSPTLAEVREWIEPQLATGPIEITVVGDVDKELVVREVARTFGALPARAEPVTSFGDKAELTFPDGTTTPFEFYHRGNAEQALVYVYWPAPDASDPADSYRMRLLRGVFRNRLIEVLREEMGSTYSPAAGAFSNSLFEGYGYLVARVTAKPDEVDTVRAGIMRVANEMARDGITADAFERAVTPLIEDLDSTLENNSYWMAVLSDAQSGAHGLARFRAQAPTYRNATAEEISALAREVFTEDRSVTAFIVPATEAAPAKGG
ncbi:MAG: insulinase family protein, partial [Pseudomonadota bacterium]